MNGERRAAAGWQSIGTSMVALIVLLLLWQTATAAFSVPTFILPSPVDIGRAMAEDYPQLLRASRTTSRAVLLGFIVGNVTGLVLAIAVASSRTAARVVMPAALAVRSVPIIALAPFLVLYVGRGLIAVTFVVALIVFFPTLVNGVLGLRSADPRARQLMLVLSASWLQRLVRLSLPNALPHLFAALRISAPSAVLGAMIAEWVVSGDGLGALILSASISSQTSLMWAAVVVSTALAGMAFMAVALVQRFAVPWESGAHHG